MKTILYHSNDSKAYTGFGKHAKNMLKYLQKTGKYKIVELANGSDWEDKKHKLKPWLCHGSLPHPKVQNDVQRNPDAVRPMHYGHNMIDKAIAEIKPDVYIGVEDIWGFAGFWDKPWWNKTNSMIWTTLDSQPILPQALEAAPKTENFYVWSSFAERDMKKIGHDHVKTLHGSVNTDDFYRFSDQQRAYLKEAFGLGDSYVVGFVFRNQLRKSVPNMLDGFKIFKKDCPKAKLLLHTSWSEGWDIPRLLKEKDIPPEDILTTYICSECKNYMIKPFTGEKQNCPYCGQKGTFSTTSTGNGVDEEQLNEIYNLMDVYCHPFTSGGMEIPIFEAKLTELITLVTNYSCGEDSCTSESGGLELEWAEYREPGTQFIKASTYPSSIAKQLKKVWKMKQEKVREIGKKAKQYTIDNYSVDSIGKKLEVIIDNMPDRKKELEELVSKNSEHIKKLDLSAKLDKGKKIAIVIPESAGDVLWINSLITNFKKLYKEYKLYVFCKPHFNTYIEDHPDVEKTLEWEQAVENPQTLEGQHDHKGYFDMAFYPHHRTQIQQIQSYHHNAQDRSVYNYYEN